MVPPLQLSVFDVRRGRTEGQEADKVLGFYPASVDTDEQASVVGLVQAMSAFSSIFDQVSSYIFQMKSYTSVQKSGSMHLKAP